MSEVRVVDADCHILEPPDIWKIWLAERYQDREGPCGRRRVVDRGRR